MNVDTEQFVGLPYVDRGRSLNGVDCWGLVVLVYAAHGIELPSYDQYADVGIHERAELARIIDGHRETWTDIPHGAERALDIVLLRVVGHPSHVGVVVRPGLMLHVSRGSLSCVERYASARWRSRVAGLHRYTP